MDAKVTGLEKKASGLALRDDGYTYGYVTSREGIEHVLALPKYTSDNLREAAERYGTQQ